MRQMPPKTTGEEFLLLQWTIDREEILRSLVKQKCRIKPPVTATPKQWDPVPKPYNQSRILQYFAANPEDTKAPREVTCLPENMQAGQTARGLRLEIS
jgi:hypothetical protein